MLLLQRQIGGKAVKIMLSKGFSAAFITITTHKVFNIAGKPSLPCARVGHFRHVPSLAECRESMSPEYQPANIFPVNEMPSEWYQLNVFQPWLEDPRDLLRRVHAPGKSETCPPLSLPWLHFSKPCVVTSVKFIPGATKRTLLPATGISRSLVETFPDMPVHQYARMTGRGTANWFCNLLPARHRFTIRRFIGGMTVKIAVEITSCHSVCRVTCVRPLQRVVIGGQVDLV